ncbi:MAG: endolytic transglycosylase MltG [Bacteroidetes bacterium]|nr:endolytic transglycosylase MltG [Bacteroidota bacterium]
MSPGFRRILIAFASVIVLSICIIVLSFYNKVFSPNVDLSSGKSRFVYIPTGSTFIDVMRLLEKQGLLKNSASFQWVSEQMKYTTNVKPGKYEIKQGMNNKELISLLRSGKQTPVKLTFSNIRTVEELAGVTGGKIEADSASIAFLLNDEAFLEKYGFNARNSLCILIPNTYELKWNTSAEQFFERMAKEYKKFWNEKRRAKAKEIGLTQVEISVLASIVEKETRKNDEKATVAGVYMNRYLKGWKLEADPTLVFASGDFSLRRVLNEHKDIDSPYNTYMYTGFPPGPICMPSVSSIDAVLNYSKHEYMFFCAREDFSGYHSFAKTYDQHLLNARRFQKELDRRGIRS